MTVNIKDELEFINCFIGEHSSVLDSPNTCGIFSVGVCVGIIMEIQKKEFKNIPFWNQLNRLDISANQIPQIFTNAKNKLHQYRSYLNEDTTELQFNELFANLGSKHISNFDINSDISNDKLNFVFSIGLSVGYLIYHQNI